MIFLCGLFNGMEYIYAVNNAQTTKMEVEVRFQFHLSSVDCARARGSEANCGSVIALRTYCTFASADRMPPSQSSRSIGRPAIDRPIEFS